MIVFWDYINKQEKVNVMSIKFKSALFALALTPVFAIANDLGNDELTHNLYAISASNSIENDTMANINRTIDRNPTAAGALNTGSIADYYGLDFDVEHSAH
jgi:hypothetical protein